MNGLKVFLGLLVIAAVAGGFWFIQQRGLATHAGDAENAWFVQRGSAAPVLVFENQIRSGGRRGPTASRTRLVSVDVATGATHEAHWDDTSVAFMCDPSGSDVLDCGDIGKLDPVTLAVRTPATKRRLADPSMPGCGKSDYAEVGKTRLHIANESVAINEPERTIDGPRGGSRTAELPASVVAVPLTGEPQFLTERNRADRTFVTAKGALAVRAYGQGYVVSLIAADGHAAWSTPIGGECQRAQLVGDALVIATEAADPRALAIDTATGAVRWHVAAAP